MSILGILLLSYIFWPIAIGIFISLFIIGSGCTLYFGYQFIILTITTSLVLIQSFRNSVLEPTSYAIANNIRKSFPIHLPETSLPDTAIYSWHPHGLYAISPFIHCCSSITSWSPNISLATHSYLSSLPFINLLPIKNKIIPINEDVIVRELDRNISVCLLPGGVRESFKITKNKFNLVIKDRKGIFRIAIKQNVPIVPILAFGENDLFEQIDSRWNDKLQIFIDSIIGIQLPLPTWKSIKKWFTLLRKPFDRPIESFVGEPVYPLADDTVESMRARYIEALEGLYLKHRPNDWAESIEYS